MGVAQDIEATLGAKFEVMLPHLDERQRRLLLAAEARAWGHGGIRRVARAAGVREATISAGVAELESGEINKLAEDQHPRSRSSTCRPRE